MRDVQFRSMNKIPIETKGNVIYDGIDEDSDDIKYLLPMFEEFAEDTERMVVCGLILATANDKEKGYFRRLGFFVIYAKGEHFGQLLGLLPQEDCAPSRMKRLAKTLKLSSKSKNTVSLRDESAFAEVISVEEIRSYELTGAMNTKRINFYDKGRKFYNINLV